jgi:4-hydroxybenzoate polyprenyltransferase
MGSDFAITGAATSKLETIPGDVSETNVPLCVDLDGTLITTDLFWEAVFTLLSQNPFNLVRLLAWAVRGRAYLKREVFRRIEVDPTSLPYNQELLSYLVAESENRQILLVTATDAKPAQLIANHLGLFSRVISSDGMQNMSGAAKRAMLVSQFGEKGYDYVGNARADLPVWQFCRRALLVNATASLRNAAASVAPVGRTFGRPTSRVRAFLKVLRVHQWLKNILLFIPILTSHQIFRSEPLKQALLAFISFSLCASSAYILNDLFDIKCDRLQAEKRERPLAAGSLSVPQGMVLMVALLIVSILISRALSWQFQITLLFYYVMTLAYSLVLKRRMLVDVFVLGGLYVIRVLAGSAATAIKPSAWLLAFCLFFFLNLAILKRFAELRQMDKNNTEAVAGRAYYAGDLSPLGSLGTSSGFMCVLVLALYINSPQVVPLYKSPSILWFLCPLLLYWISRVWVFAYRGKMILDPVVFALGDRISYLTALCGGAILALATVGLH